MNALDIHVISAIVGIIRWRSRSINGAFIGTHKQMHSVSNQKWLLFPRHPIQAVPISFDCILNDWTCTMRVQRKFAHETKFMCIYLCDYLWPNFSFVVHFCAMDLCVFGREHLIIGSYFWISQPKNEEKTHCVQSLVSDQRYTSFWRIVCFEPREKSFCYSSEYELPIFACLLWKSDDDDEWTMPQSVLFIFSVFSQVDHCFLRRS